ncbi:MAG: carbohydrate ABC transporter permease [Spirochaetia bacterium]|nr:carbohydrate ABC transporter permease [Spirochaetia bacterium]
MKKKHRIIRHRILSTLLFVLITFWCLAPLVWIGITSVKPQGTEYKIPVEYWPENPTIENYGVVLGEKFRVQQSIFNSIIVSSTALIGTLILSIFSAYAIARLRFRFRYHSLYFIQIAGMIPPIVVIGPTFVLLRHFGLLRTYWAMILPNMAYAVPLASFLIASYFANIPFDLEDAAKIDGCGSTRIVWNVVLPIAAPGIFSAGVLAFLGCWGEFMLAFTVTLGKKSVETVPVAILNMSQAFQLQWTWVSAGTIISLIPIVVAVLVFQRYVVRGLTNGAVK